MLPPFLRLAFSSKLIALLLSPLLGAGQVFSQVQPSSSAKSETKYSLSGTVVNAVTGEPIRRALVQIMGPEQASLTDDTGHFEFNGLSPGQTSVTVQKPGFFSEAEAARKGSSPVLVTVGPEMGAIVLRLIPEAVIRGKVTGEGDEPIEGVHVVALAVHMNDGHKLWEQVGRTRTDEDGEFRISNLTPGTYYLEAGPKLRSSFPNARSATRQLGLAAAYYAGTPVRESATAIELGPGQQFEAELSLKPEPLFHITGTISGLSDSQGTSVQVVNRYGEAVPVPVRIEQETGQFQTNVPAGSYLLRANSWREGGLSSSAELPLAISSDMDGLQIAVLPPHPILVMVKFEPVHRHRRSELEPTQLVSVRLRPAEFAVPALWYSVNVEKIQGRPSLVIRDLSPGKYSVEFEPAADWYVQQAQCGSTDLLNDQLTVLAGARTPPIEIVLRDDGASVKGTVAMGEGRKRAGVFVVPARAAEKTKMIWTSPGGDFAQSGLAPGEYDVIALDRADAIEYANPEVMGKYLTRGMHITLQAAETRSIALDLVRVGK